MRKIWQNKTAQEGTKRSCPDLHRLILHSNLHLTLKDRFSCEILKFNNDIKEPYFKISHIIYKLLYKVVESPINILNIIFAFAVLHFYIKDTSQPIMQGHNAVHNMEEPKVQTLSISFMLQ